jgi:hypothetical protein
VNISAHVPGICWPLVSGLFTVKQKLIQLLLEVLLGSMFKQINSCSIFGGGGMTENKPCPGLVMLLCPSFSNPVAITAGSKQRDVCDELSGGALVVRICMVFSLPATQLIVVPGEPILGDARHLHSREHHRAHAVETSGEDVHQTGVAWCEYEMTLDAMSDAIVDTGYLIRCAGRR